MKVALCNHILCPKAYISSLFLVLSPLHQLVLSFHSLFLAFPFLSTFSFSPSRGFCGPLWRPWPYEVTDHWSMNCCSEAAEPPLVPQWGLCTPLQKEVGFIWRILLLQLGEFSTGSLPVQIIEQGFCADIRPMLEQQLYQLELVQLIIYCWGNGS